MRYISGPHSLNLDVDDKTSGDWHTSALRWQDIFYLDSDSMTLGNWDIYQDRVLDLPEHGVQLVNVASHVRACLDLLELGRFGAVQGMRRDLICNESLNQTIFEKVSLLKDSSHWQAIDLFMKKEYGLDWILYGKEHCG